ncbi:nucleotide exchange factor GrpE [bacterium]|nr:nucleotide exchange factor GrpE [bacterium]|tara:strand:- start:3044 stop:3556 length:513 start_codon:yes stop_codon:yes gene_type:complete
MTKQTKDDKKPHVKSTDITKEFSELKAKAEEHLNGWKRAQADYQNLKKEMEGKASEAIVLGRTSLIIALLPIVDNFLMAEKHIPEDQRDQDWVKGILQVKKQMDGMLKELGVETIKTVGEKFDPAFHEAVALSEGRADKESGKSGQVIEEVQPGYKMADQVIRPAKVRVS